MRSSDHRNAASVLPDPVGATTSACRSVDTASHAPACAGVGASNAPENHARVGAVKRSRGSTVTRPFSPDPPTPARRRDRAPVDRRVPARALRPGTQRSRTDASFAHGRVARPCRARAGTWQAGGVRYREFWELVDEVFGDVYGRTLARDQVLTALDDRTAAQAIDDGVEPRVVWYALCDALDVPDARRWGRDEHRQAPPAR